jgi:predicted ATP-binding protein involved in virulence
MTKPFKDTSKAIRQLIQNVGKGNFESSFQLYQNYDTGKNVDKKDEVLANKYFEKFERLIVDKKLCLKSLQLSEFRRFRDLKIDFDERITVIIGDNGAGKTSIAEALSKTLSWFNNNLEKADINGRPVTPTDINVNSTDYAEVTSNFQFDKNNSFEASLARTVSFNPKKQTSEVEKIKTFASMYRHTAKNTSIMIPLLAFYSVERSDISLNQTVYEKVTGETVSNRFTALKDSLEGSGKLDDFSEMYIELVNLAEGENTSNVKSLRSDIFTLEKTINEVFEGKVLPKDDPFLAKLNSKKRDLDILLKSSSSPKYQEHLRLVNSAIENLVPEVKNLEIDRSSGKPKLLVDNFGNKVNISQLSQGQKMLVALTGDLARRLVTLNPDAADPLNGHGIVIIDEVELHLHPKWQQDILLGLQDTFQGIQFIITTHSPQVLSTVDNKCIRQICPDEDGKLIIKVPEFQTKGIRSSDILEQIMGTFSIPRIAEAQWLSDYSALIVEGKCGDEAGVKLYKSLIEHFGEKHPEIERLQGEIRLQEFKMKAARLKKIKSKS